MHEPRLRAGFFVGVGFACSAKENKKPRESWTGGVLCTARSIIEQAIDQSSIKWCEEGDSNPYTLAGVRT